MSKMTSRECWTVVILLQGLALTGLGLSLPDDGKKEERSVLDMLTAIEARLASMEAGGQLVSSANCMAGRMDAFEVKLGRIEAKLEEHLSKIREDEIAKEVLKEPSASELSRKMDSTAEKLFARLGIFEAKSNIQMTGVGVKIQRMERQLGRSMDDTLEKILKIEEKNTQMMESLWTMAVLGQGGGGGQGPVKLRASALDVQLDDDDRWPADGQEAAATARCPSALLLHNLSTALADATLVSEKKVAELDADVEIYTRKVLNAFGELSAEYKGFEKGLSKVEGQGNHTHELLRDGVRRIIQHMKPITAFDDILQSLHKKVSEFENTIDASFASLLVAQNTFIGLLQRLVTKMDEKSSSPVLPLHSSSDVLWTALESHRKDVGRALHDLVWTVIKVGNDTVDRVTDAFGRPKHCPCGYFSVPPRVDGGAEEEKEASSSEATASPAATTREEAGAVEEDDKTRSKSDKKISSSEDLTRT